MTSKTLLKLHLLSAALILLTAPLQAQLSGSDDFNDNSKDTAKWGADVVSGGVSWVEANGRLEYLVNTTHPQDDVQRPWLLNSARNADSFDVILDVFNNVSPTGENSASIGLTVTSLENADDNLYIELCRTGPLGDGKGFLGALRTTALNVEGDHEVLDGSGNYTSPTAHPAVTTGSVRLNYNPSTKVFTAYYDTTGSADGFQWQVYGSFGVSAVGGGTMRNGVWQLGQNLGFKVGVSAFSEGGAVPSGAVHADNFSIPSVSVLGLTKTRHYNQVSAAATSLTEFSMQAFISGHAITSTFPASSNRFQPAGGSETPLIFESFGDWFYESFHASQSALDASFPNGNYSFKVGSLPTVSLTFTANNYPVVPMITPSAGTWSTGRLYLTTAQAAAGFRLVSNVSTGNGLLSLVVDSESLDEDVHFETVNQNQSGDQFLDVLVPGGSLQEGLLYTVEAEFDNSVSSPLIGQAWAAASARGNALFSSRTTLEIQVVTAQQGWRQQYFGSTSNSGAAADTGDGDNDGLPNLLEWACNLHPVAPSTLPAAAVRTGVNIEFTYPRSTSAVNAGVQMAVEWSDTLATGSWSTTGVTQATQSDNGTVQQVQATLPAGTAGRRFVRLKVTAP
jgi:hypothetical protein